MTAHVHRGFYQVTVGPLGVCLVRENRSAPVDVLRRRTYLRFVRLPGRRLFIVSWLPL